MIVIVLAVVAGYSYYEARDMIKGPEINIASPRNGVAVNRSLVEVKGTARNISHLELNGRKIFTDEQGNFSEELLLARGYNIIEVKATDKFNRETKKLLEIVYK